MSYEIDTASYRAEIDEILRKYGLEPSILELVPSVKQAVAAHGHHDPSDTRCGATIPLGGHFRIFVANPITDSGYLQVLARFHHYEYDRKLVDAIAEPRAFVTHLTLHEIYWVLHGISNDQFANDAWAFREMGLS